jgi:F0F1-type ATP synthase assembly protein I
LLNFGLNQRSLLVLLRLIFLRKILARKTTTILIRTVGFNAEKPNEMKKNLDELSNEDLLNEAKKMKSTAIINATLIGVLIGILIYSIAVNKFGFLTLILLFLIYKFANNSKYNKEEIENLLKVRNLK